MPVSKEYLKTNQYRTADNLLARRELFDFGTNPEPLWAWVAKQYTIQPESRILEVGCGSGDFWQEAAKIFPKNCILTLTDLSPGMLKNAEKTFNSTLDCEFEVADVENLSYGNHCFDVVLAHLMLYHADSPEQAIKEIKRVLKPSGFSGILLSEENNMQSLFTLLSCENPRQATRFSAESAATLLPKYFSKIQHLIYQNTLKICEVEPLITYLRSLSKMDEKGNDFYSHCREILTKYIKDEGYISFENYRHLFIVYQSI